LEAYPLRQALIKILAVIIQQVLTRQLDVSAEVKATYEKTKEKFLDILCKRFQDKSAYCRTKTIKVFTKLIENNVIPRWRYVTIFRLVASRIKDVTALVRKKALKLVPIIIGVFAHIFTQNQNEPFLRVAEVEKSLQTCQ